MLAAFLSLDEVNLLTVFLATCSSDVISFVEDLIVFNTWKNLVFESCIEYGFIESLLEDSQRSSKDG
jgi:hypothetical protein